LLPLRGARQKNAGQKNGISYFSVRHFSVCKHSFNGTRMTRMRRIIADEEKKIGVVPHYPRSINCYTDMETASDEDRGL